MEVNFILILAFIFILGLSGCTQQNSQQKTAAELATEACITLCKAELLAAKDLSNGPCLSNEIIADWVCDVAHNPRQPIDNKLENQCPQYGKTAHHFVEVTPECEFIKAV